MPHVRYVFVAVGVLMAAWCAACGAMLAKPAGPTADQARMLAIRAAQVDAVNRLIETVMAARVSAVKTVGGAIGPGSDKEIALRVFLRAARRVGEPRVYSDGVAEVDVELPVAAVVRRVAELYTPGEHETGELADLRYVAVDGYVRAGGRGRPLRDPSAEVLERLESVPLEEMPERIGGLVDGLSASEAMFDGFVRSLPVAGPARMMPDRVAEVDVVAMTADLIRVLKDIRTLRGDEAWTDEQLDRLSIRLKEPRLTATGRGMPPASEIRPADATVTRPKALLPDWAAETVEAQGEAPFSPDAKDREEARVLAARSAKARALDAVEKKVDAVTLAGGVTVRQRAAKDSRFRRDLKTFLSSVRVVVSRPTEDGKGWEVRLRLPLLRLYECSLSHD